MEKRIELDIVIIPEKIGKSTVYSISSIQVPNIVTQGDTIEEAKKNLKEALELYFEEAPQEKSLVIQETKEENLPMISRILI
jgi:predicted RNase H-like HicB family nuclease